MDNDIPQKPDAEVLELDDPRPSPHWQPSPEQIRRWSLEIRAENNELPQPDEFRHMKDGVPCHE